MAASKVNVLLIGSGGREHALAHGLRRSPRLGNLFTDGQNPGILSLAQRADVPINPKDPHQLRKFCLTQRIGLVVIGPEEPLAAGLADVLSEGSKAGGGLQAPVPAVFGPVKAGAMLEADKAFAKELMRGAAIPTAESRTFSDAEAARTFLASRSEPWVIKAAGLAKGKGVFVPETQAEAMAAIDRIMVKREFGDAGRTVVIEERLKGREVSVFALCDGRTIYVLDACQDHKRLGNGATGPNTGGMGAICPARSVDAKLMARVEREVLVPTVDALKREGIDYRGVLYAGLMLTPAGPKVLEYNCRFGDPECQVLVRRFDGDLLDTMLATAERRLEKADFGWKPGAAVCVVLAAAGYPDKPRSGDVIEGLEEAAAVEGVEVFHAGTARDAQGRVVTAGGRVLNVTAVGATAEEARARAYRAAELIRFEGKQYRTDIGTDVVG
ncbi:MAG: phosphoribosylamine--glycine ligase [Phycisphaeraceae bacterium]|nr:phosphoribosylamine--glycine ligase [Phycisphaeraceae bacterium]